MKSPQWKGDKKGKTIKVKGIKLYWSENLQKYVSAPEEDITERIELALNESDVFWNMVDKDKFRSLQKALKNDDQSRKLLDDIGKFFFRKFQLKGQEEYAFNRLMNIISSKVRDEGNLRNQIFKIANELGMKLPSSSF